MDFFSFQEQMKKNAATSAEPPKKPPRDILTVSQLTSQIETSLKRTFPSMLHVQGEVSNLRPMHNGHLYFSLKDAHNCIDCVMWKNDAERLKFVPKDGMELLVAGRVGIWGPAGKYQIIVARLTPLGQGALEEALRQLREKLEREGLFHPERKRPLPAYPSRIILLTGRQTAALQDMLKVLRRFTWLRLMIYDVPVQGDGAAERIALAIGEINRFALKLGGVDLLLLGRGGGSLEDLWEFNQEVLARAIVASKIPIITGIGHEIDVSIADLAADYHAHTPTEAAQIATQHWRNAKTLVETTTFRLRREIHSRLTDLRRRLAAVERHEVFRRPLERINALRQRLDHRQRALMLAVGNRLRISGQRLGRLTTRLNERHPRHTLALAAQRNQLFSQRLRRAMEQLILRRRGQMEALHAQLIALSPTEVLRRGYSITTLKKTGEILRSTSQVKAGDRLVTRVADGTTESVVEDKRQLPLFE